MLSFGQLQERLSDSPQAYYIVRVSSAFFVSLLKYRLTCRVKSRLLLTNASDSKFIYLYETRVSSKVLRMLDNPGTASAAGWPTIQRRTIPFKPFETFMRRLVHTLLEPNILHNCEASEAVVDVDPIVTASLKRKRVAENDDSCQLRRKL